MSPKQGRFCSVVQTAKDLMIGIYLEWKLSIQEQAAPGYTINEILIALVMVGILASFSIPKVIGYHLDRKVSATVKDSFLSVGEAYLLRKEDVDNTGAEDIGGTERNNFRNFLNTHLNYISRDTSVVDPATYTAAGLFNLRGGARITQISDITTTSPQTLQVRMAVTKANGDVIDYYVVIPEDVDRYTTMYGFTGNAADCTQADEILHIVDECP